MSDSQYILALDEGTTSCTALLIDSSGQVTTKFSKEIQQIFPQPGWVEHDPLRIWQTVLDVVREVVRAKGINFQQIASIGITNQRETTVVWDRRSGLPVSNAIVWQCRRTASACKLLKERGLAPFIQEKTGLVIDAYFSASKIRWILDNIPQGQLRAERGDLLFGNIDSWLVWKLTGGKVHITDYSNASRTMLFNIKSLKWDSELLDLFKVPQCMLPSVCPSSQIYGETQKGLLGDKSIPIGAVIGDQQSSLFGQACYNTGQSKNTYGTGCFILMNSGDKAITSSKGLISTIAWGLNGKVAYALEGSAFVTGSAVQWLRDGLKIISSASETEAMALSVKDNGGVFFVPAFTGLGTPYWDQYARGTMVGLTRGTTREHIVRATLESIPFQVRDIVDTMQAETGLPISLLRVDGGGSANRFTMQFQADILNIPVQVSAVAETTALGAAFLAGLAVGIWKDTQQISRKWKVAETYEPRISADQRAYLYKRWQRAVKSSLGWAEDEG